MRLGAWGLGGVRGPGGCGGGGGGNGYSMTISGQDLIARHLLNFIFIFSSEAAGVGDLHPVEMLQDQVKTILKIVLLQKDNLLNKIKVVNIFLTKNFLVPK